MSTRIKDTLVRAAKTAAQTFLSLIALSAADVTDWNTAKAALVAAGAAAISAAWNSLTKP